MPSTIAASSSIGRVGHARVRDAVVLPHRGRARDGAVDAGARPVELDRPAPARQRVPGELALALEHREPEQPVAVVELHRAVRLRVHAGEREAVDRSSSARVSVVGRVVERVGRVARDALPTFGSSLVRARRHRLRLGQLRRTRSCRTRRPRPSSWSRRSSMPVVVVEEQPLAHPLRAGCAGSRRSSRAGSRPTRRAPTAKSVLGRRDPAPGPWRARPRAAASPTRSSAAGGSRRRRRRSLPKWSTPSLHLHRDVLSCRCRPPSCHSTIDGAGELVVRRRRPGTARRSCGPRPSRRRRCAPPGATDTRSSPAASAPATPVTTRRLIAAAPGS